MDHKNNKSNTDVNKKPRFKILAPDFKRTNNGHGDTEKLTIPQVYTCEGKNEFPRFQFYNPPAEAKALAIVVDDPDSLPVAGKIVTHFIATNIPTKSSRYNRYNDGYNDRYNCQNAINRCIELSKFNIDAKHASQIQVRMRPREQLRGISHTAWRGPCPPDKTHVYRFTLFALSDYTPPILDKLNLEMFKTKFDKLIIDVTTMYASYTPQGPKL